jgi:hypothetical protein
MPWRLPQHLSVAESRRVFRSYMKPGNLRRNMLLGLHNANPAAAAAELERLYNANTTLRRNLAQKYDITPLQVSINMFRTFEGHQAQNAIAQNAARAGREFQNRKTAKNAWSASQVMRELAAATHNPVTRMNRNRRIHRRYAKSASPPKRTRSATPRRATSAPRNRSPPKAPSPHRRQLTMADVKRILSLNTGPRPSNVKKARSR